jgi:membrane fusion protein (multidrug efflux system)
MERTNTALLNGHKAAATEESAATQERGNAENLLTESPRAIAQAEANLREAQLQLSYTNIIAPADGQVRVSVAI